MRAASRRRGRHTSVGKGLSEALVDGQHLETSIVDGLRENVVDGEVDRLLVEVVLEDDESSVHRGSSEVHEALNVVVGGGSVDGAGSELPVLSVWG